MPLPRPSRRALRIGIIALAAAALAIVAERSEWVRALGTGGTARAWIWAPVELRDVRPRAFFAAREFELAAVPQRAILEVLGDEEYVAWANGWRIGSGRYRAGAPLDRYEVARYLHLNRADIERLVGDRDIPCERHGGRLAVSRTADGYTRFTLTLPVDVA